MRWELGSFIIPWKTVLYKRKILRNKKQLYTKFITHVVVVPAFTEPEKSHEVGIGGRDASASEIPLI